MPRSTTLRAGYEAQGWGFVRRTRAEMTALMSCCANRVRKASTSLGPGRDQIGSAARPSRWPPRPGPGCCRDAAARHAQTQGTTLSIRQHVELVPEAASAEAEDGLRLSFFGAPAALAGARPTVLSRRTADKSGSACL